MPAAGVPASAAVPSPLSVRLTPLGSAPVSEIDGVGAPVVVTANVAAFPTWNMTLLALVIAGAVGVKLIVYLMAMDAAVPSPATPVVPAGAYDDPPPPPVPPNV